MADKKPMSKKPLDPKIDKQRLMDLLVEIVNEMYVYGQFISQERGIDLLKKIGKL